MTGVRGSTLLEALIGLAIAVFLMSALGTFGLFQHRRLGAETRTVSARQGMRAALDLLAAELREAGRREPGVSYASPPGFCLRDDDRVRVTTDRDGDGETDGPGEDVTYCHCAADSVLYRAWRPYAGASFTVERLAEPVTSFTIGYEPRSVEVLMRVAVDTPLGTFEEEARTRSFLRNAAGTTSCDAGPSCPPPECGS